MRKLFMGVLGAAFAFAMSAGVASATHNEPLQAKLMKGEFVKAYVPCNNASCTAAGVPYSCCTGTGAGSCNAGNATTSNLFPACTPAIESEPKCYWGTGGKGKFLAKSNPAGADKLIGTSDDGDIDLQVTLVGLGAGCEGQLLDLRASVRATADDCGGAACTVVNLNDFLLVSGVVVVGGKVKIKTTVNSQLPGTILPGKKLGICIVGVNIFKGTKPVFWGGILVP